jgi:hypothetical protein
MNRIELVAGWLTGQLPAERSIGGWLAEVSAWERMALVREVLAARPALAHTVQRMSVYEQLVLSVELVGRQEQPKWSARCFGRRTRGRPRPHWTH